MRKSPFFPKHVLWHVQRAQGASALGQPFRKTCAQLRGGWWIQREKSLPEAQCKQQENVSGCNTKGTWGSPHTFTQAQAERWPWHTADRQGGSCNARVLCAPQEIQQLRELRNWPEQLPGLTSATQEDPETRAGTEALPPEQQGVRSAYP